jgi:hypothetical protein
MAFVLLIIGLVLLVSGVRNTASSDGSGNLGLYDLVKGEFTGDHSYMTWVFAILVIGALGYIDQLKSLSRSFLVLVLVVLILSNGGFFDKFSQELFGAKQS